MPNRYSAAVPLSRTGEMLSLLKSMKHLPVEVMLYLEAISASLPIFGMTQHSAAPLLRLMKRPLDGRNSDLKGLVNGILAAAAVKLTSPGPVFYRQRCHGFARKPVLIFQSCSMYLNDCDAPDALAAH